MYDCHNHYLPGLDDGPEDWTDSLAMARIAVAEGITDVVLTPHLEWLAGADTVRRDRLLAAAAECRGRLAAAGLDLRVYPGAEVRLRADLLHAVQAGAVLTLGDTGRYLLVEPPLGDLPDYAGDVLSELSLVGITPVLAHPERNRTIAADPALAGELAGRGCLVQVNAGSLLGHSGDRVRRCALTLLEQGWVHLLGSDAHDPVRRPPCLKAAGDLIARVAGAPAADLILRRNPRAVLSGQDLPLGVSGAAGLAGAADGGVPLRRREGWFSRLAALRR